MIGGREGRRVRVNSTENIALVIVQLTRYFAELCTQFKTA